MRNYTEAMRWYRMAANGLGVPRDLGQARQWWRKAAAGGNDDAKKSLAKYGG